MLKTKSFSRIFWIAICAVVFSVVLPLEALGQRRRTVWRPHRSRIVVYNYQPRPYVVYQRRPNYSYRSYTYGYPQSDYGRRSYTYGYPQSDYGRRYYSYRYSQPYFANRYTYSWANPTYNYDGYRYRPRHRNSGFRIRIRL